MFTDIPIVIGNKYCINIQHKTNILYVSKLDASVCIRHARNANAVPKLNKSYQAAVVSILFSLLTLPTSTL